MTLMCAPAQAVLWCMQVIYAKLEAGFASEADAWDLRARRWLSQHPPNRDASAEEAAGAVYTEALAATQCPQLYDLYLAFLGERLEAWAGVHGVDHQGALPKLKGQGKSLAKQMLQVRRPWPSV